MKHTPPERLGEWERDTLRAIAEAVIPPGRFIGGANDDTVTKVEEYLASFGRGTLPVLRTLLRALDANAYARHLRPLRRLPVDKRLAVLETWRRGGYLRRQALRAVVFPLKLAYFADPDLYQKLGCVYDREAARSDERPRYMSERVVRAADLPPGETIECDVVVVGTGAGGAVIGKELAEKGLAVVLLEEGDYVTRKDFGGRTMDMHRKLYRNMLTTTALGNASIPVPVGRSVGGSTTINSGTCYRPPGRVFKKWQKEFGLAELTPERLGPYFDKVEGILRVKRADARFLGGTARVVARGADALGYKHVPLLRNAPDCDGKGVCCFGCPTDAKRSTNVSYVPLALRAGAMLVTGAKVKRVLVERGRAVGVEAQAAGSGARVVVRARATVLSCGTLHTPVLLAENGLARGSGQLGRNLSIHPATGAMAWFDEKILGYNGIPQGYAIEEFHDEGILFEGGTPPIDLGAATVSLLGPRYVELMESFDHVATFGFLVEDTSRGRVFARSGRPLVTYVLNDQDVARIKRGLEILSRVFFAAGASVVLPLVHGFDELRGEADLRRFREAKISARDLDLTGYHPLGTCRMGADPKRSVVSQDHAVWDVPDLYVVDGSAVPSSLAVNPQVTIMALATRAADRLAARLT